MERRCSGPRFAGLVGCTDSWEYWALAAAADEQPLAMEERQKRHSIVVERKPGYRAVEDVQVYTAAPALEAKAT